MSYMRFALMAFVVSLFAVGPAGTVATSFAQDDEAVVETTADHDHETVEGAGGDHPEGDHAEGDHGALPPILSFDPGAAVINLAIFLATFVFLAKFVWPVILGGLKAREEKIAGDLHDAQAANRQAEATLAEYKKKVQEVANEAQGILAEARRDAQASATKIVDQAKADAQRQGERALADIETAKKVALAEIAGQTSVLAMSVAKQVVGRELKAEDHAELIKNALEQIPSKN